MQKLILIVQTLLYIKPIQIRYQLWYRFLHLLGQKKRHNLFLDRIGAPLFFNPWIDNPTSLRYNINKKDDELNELTFTFLNISNSYTKGNIAWNEENFGKLWTYNLNYMDFLLQSNMERELGYDLINSFIEDLPHNPTALESYPIALRGVNWIKFLNRHSLDENTENRIFVNQPELKKQIDGSLYAQYYILYKNPEYHLLANHLLENGFSLLFGAFYFNDYIFYRKARYIIESELTEQILNDGGHFELSPMYHQIILERLLDCINLLQNNHRFSNQEKLLELLKYDAKKMLSWMKNITFSSGDLPMLNDAAPGIAPNTAQLIKYASALGLYSDELNSKLSDSGYRKYSCFNYECIIDIGQIGPTYQPGHAHADTFNFVLYAKKKPIIVDPGISTYELGKTRLNERGTAGHNTVSILDRDSSEVWASHRVGRRAIVTIMKDIDNNIKAQHNGYYNLGTFHQREWKFSENTIEITDTLKGKVRNGIAHFWFSSGIGVDRIGGTLDTAFVSINFEFSETIDLLNTKIPDGYNKFSDNYKVEVKFKEFLKTKITIK